jgi:hypothetical protein
MAGRIDAAPETGASLPPATRSRPLRSGVPDIGADGDDLASARGVLASAAVSVILWAGLVFVVAWLW